MSRTPAIRVSSFSEAKQAWPHSAQLAAAFLIGAATAFLAFHTSTFARFGAKPSTLHAGANAKYRVDLNHAERAELLQLPGVGETLAERLDDDRRTNGPFRSVDDLRRVRGIGPSTLERLRPYIRVAGEDNSIPPSSRRQQTAARSSGSKADNLTEPIDVNTASLSELQRLPGIGAKLSQRIVDERQKRPFRSIEDLRSVPGIGPKTLEKLRPHVKVEVQTTDVAAAKQP